jgi:hypothetical protein
MTEWIKYEDQKPTTDITALVFNEKGFMCGGDVLALYCHRYEIWRLYDPNYSPALTLEVSHYLPIPSLPKVI